MSPRVDPRRENVDAFRPLYNDFVVLLTAFLATAHAVVLAVNLGYDVPISSVVYAGVGLLVFFLGFLLERAERNWVVGPLLVSALALVVYSYYLFERESDSDTVLSR